MRSCSVLSASRCAHGSVDAAIASRSDDAGPANGPGNGADDADNDDIAFVAADSNDDPDGDDDDNDDNAAVAADSNDDAPDDDDASGAPPSSVASAVCDGAAGVVLGGITTAPATASPAPRWPGVT